MARDEFTVGNGRQEVRAGSEGIATGAVAQLGERRFCKPEVVGSIPISSTPSRDPRCRPAWTVAGIVCDSPEIARSPG